MDMNIDVKDLLAKLKGGQKKDARAGSSFVQFFEKNPKMKIIIPAIFLIIAAVVAAVFIVSGLKTETDVDPNIQAAGISVDVLPMIERSEGVSLADGVDPFAEDVIANAKLTGIFYNSDGFRTAILQTEYASYIVQVGDYVGDSTWLVEEITDSDATFSTGEKVRTISLTGTSGK
ncbi:MAG: hypothetical protein ACI4K9_05415 [Candidatus Fimenecus sp.]